MSGWHFNILGEPTLCKILITCENDFDKITCPDSMSIFIIDGFYGRKSRDA